MMTKAYLESVIGRMGEKAEIIIFARDALAYLDRSETAEAERDALAERIGFLQVERDTVWNQADTFRAERDAVTVERDELRDRASEADGKVDGLRDDLSRSRAILGAAAGDLLSDAAERAACAVQHEANAMDIIGRTLGRKVVGGADVAAIYASEEIDRLRERVKALVGAERERDRLDPHKTVLDEVRKVMGLQVGESVVDRVKDFRRTEVLIFEARKHLEPLVSDPSGDIEDLAMMVAHRIAHTVSPTDDRDLRQILRARDGESLKDAARRAAVGAEPPQVFRVRRSSVSIAHLDAPGVEVTLTGTVSSPMFFALTADQLSRLGLVVCDG